jgi:hypothetical protein
MKKKRTTRKQQASRKPAAASAAPQASDWDVVQRANVANILRKQRSGKVLSAREESLLRTALEKKNAPAAATPAVDDEDRVWLTPAEFERWLPGQGLRISHQCLYKTYLAKSATNQIKRSSDGRRIHKWNGLELIRIVQGKQDVQVDSILRRRQEAATRVVEAKAAAAELQQAERAGHLLDADLVRQVWSGAIQAQINEFRTLVHTLPPELVGKTEDEIRVLLDLHLRNAQHHLAVSYRDEATAPKGGPGA